MNLHQVADSASKNGPKRWLQHRPALTNAKGTFAMAKRQLPSPARLRKLIAYNPATGVMVWLPRAASEFTPGVKSAGAQANARNGRLAGKQVGTLGREGYFRANVDGQLLYCHRIAWAIYHGEWPANHIDHINHDRADNRISNLRVVTPTENNRNFSGSRDRLDVPFGVCRSLNGKRWIAHIKISGRKRHLGVFDLLDDAIAARKAAEKEHGFHENHGR